MVIHDDSVVKVDDDDDEVDTTGAPKTIVIEPEKVVALDEPYVIYHILSHSDISILNDFGLQG